MRQLIILGVGPHAHEMADIVRRINQVEPTWSLLGFLAPTTSADAALEIGPDITLGTYGDLPSYAEAWFVPEYNSGCQGVPYERMTSLVAPSAFVACSARIGRGTVIYPNSFVGHNAVLGDRCFVLSGSVINHDDHLADDVTLCGGVTLAGSVQVASGCYLGQACTVKQGVTIGAGSLIGMGSVVISDVAPNSVMVGNPARCLRQRTDG